MARPMAVHHGTNAILNICSIAHVRRNAYRYLTGDGYVMTEDVLDRGDAVNPDDVAVERMMDLFDALGEPTRLRLMHLIASGNEYTVNELAEQVGRASSAVSQHLATLRRFRLIRLRKRDTQHLYEVENTDILWWLAGLERAWLAGPGGAHHRVHVPTPPITALPPGWLRPPAPTPTPARASA